MTRMSAEDRRESVIRAAMIEFGRGGYDGTSTAAIAKRVGVSQPYLFRLYPNKRAIFTAAALRCIAETRRVLEEAADAAPAGDVEAAERAMDVAYQRLVGNSRDMLLMQMQIYVAVAAADAIGDHEFGKPLREAWAGLYDGQLVRLGGDHDETATHLAYGMLINTLVAMGFPQQHRVWTGFWPEGRAAVTTPPSGAGKQD
ncbi:MAG: TetR/AcrR family transcriptional regulator [Chloroflexota bacterium]